MPNLAQSLKAEIQRISRKEIKWSVTPVHSATVALKKSVAELKRRVAALESENKRLVSLEKAAQEEQSKITPEKAEKARISSKSIQALREKLGLSQEGFAKLIGISRQNVFIMEHKEVRLKMRGNTLSSILSIKDIGKREAQRRLEEIESRGKKLKKK